MLTLLLHHINQGRIFCIAFYVPIANNSKWMVPLDYVVVSSPVDETGDTITDQVNLAVKALGS